VTKRQQGNDTTGRDEVHPLDADLANLIQAMRWIGNDDVRCAIQGHLIAASQLMPLRHVEVLDPADQRYVISAMTWGGKARACVEALLVVDEP